MAEITRLEKKDMYNRWLIRTHVQGYGSTDQLDILLARKVIAAYIADPSFDTKLTATMLNHVDTIIVRMVAYAIAKIEEARDMITLYAILDNQLREQL